MEDGRGKREKGRWKRDERGKKAAVGRGGRRGWKVEGRWKREDGRWRREGKLIPEVRHEIML